MFFIPLFFIYLPRILFLEWGIFFKSLINLYVNDLFLSNLLKLCFAERKKNTTVLSMGCFTEYTFYFNCSFHALTLTCFRSSGHTLDLSFYKTIPLSYSTED